MNRARFTAEASNHAGMWIEKLLQNVDILIVDLLYIVCRKVTLGIFFHN